MDYLQKKELVFVLRLNLKTSKHYGSFLLQSREVYGQYLFRLQLESRWCMEHIRTPPATWYKLPRLPVGMQSKAIDVQSYWDLVASSSLAIEFLMLTGSYVVLGHHSQSPALPHPMTRDPKSIVLCWSPRICICHRVLDNVSPSDSEVHYKTGTTNNINCLGSSCCTFRSGCALKLQLLFFKKKRWYKLWTGAITWENRLQWRGYKQCCW